jgi:hypothetical protein
MALAHLTYIVHLGPNSWETRCDCGWSQIERTKKDARLASWYHWAAYPAVTSL